LASALVSGLVLPPVFLGTVAALRRRNRHTLRRRWNENSADVV